MTTANEQQLISYTQSGNFTAFNTLMGTLTAAELATFNPTSFSTIIGNISHYPVNGTTVTNQTLADSTRALMVKADIYVPTLDISMAIETYSRNGNVAALDAVTDYLTAQQKTILDPNLLGQALLDLAFNPSLTPSVVATSVRDFMNKLDLSVPTTAISQAIEAFARQGNVSALDAVTDYLTAQQKTILDPSLLGQALLDLAFNPTLTPTDAATAVRDFMNKLDLSVPTTAISQAIEAFAQQGNVAALDAVTDYLTAQQKTILDPSLLGQALLDLAFNPSLTPSVVATSVRDFMLKLDLSVPTTAISQAIEAFARQGNVAALDAVTDYLTAQQKTILDPILLGQALLDLAFNPSLTPSVVATSVRDFMLKLDLSVPTTAISQAIEAFAQQGNVAALDAVTDYLTAQQKTILDPSLLGQALLDLAFNPSLTPSVVATSVRDFMLKLDLSVPTTAISQAIEAFAQQGNVAALDAVTDYLTAQQKTILDPSLLGQALLDIVFNPGLGTTTIAATVEDLMTKLGATMPTTSLGQAASALATQNNLNALDSIFNHITTTQFSLLPPGDLAQIAALGITLGSNSANTITGTTGIDKIFGQGSNDIISGGNGNDFLYGDQGNDTLTGGAGNDVVNGGLGNDTYNFGRTDGADTASDNGGTDTLLLGANITRDQLWFQQSGNNLVISIIGSSDKVTVSDWFSSAANHIENIKTSDGHLLVDTKVQNLVNAMAGMTVPSTTTLTAAQHAQLDPVIAANWT